MHEYCSTNRDDTFLGTISSEIVGIQYYDGKVRASEPVHFEREPSNRHDRNAIRVENLDFEQVGHLPRKEAAWLAPLIDSGKLRLDGVVSAIYSYSHDNIHNTIPIVLNLYLCLKGKSVFQKNDNPNNDLEALHEVIRTALENVDSYHDPAITLSIGERLTAVLKRDVLPETHLLINIFPLYAEKQTAKIIIALENRIKDHIRNVTILHPVRYQNVTIYPLIGGNGNESPFMLLEPALKTGVADVHETGSTGTILYVEITNRGDKPILLLEGEILTGAKQNRVVTVSTIAVNRYTTEIPVSCVERGRWNYKVSTTFDTKFWAPPSLRSITTQAIHNNRKRSGENISDQNAVSMEVDALLRKANVSSNTADLTVLYKKHRKQIKEYMKNLCLPRNTRGVIVVSNEKLLGMDLFDSHTTLKQYWNKLSEAYFIETLINDSLPTEKEQPDIPALLASIADSVSIIDQKVDDNILFEVETDTVVGSGVWFGDAVYHLSVFPVSS